MNSNSKLDKKTIENLLPDSFSRFPVWYYDETDSTNTQAMLKVSEEGLTNGIFIADSQTKGRGRTGHTFYSPKASGIYMSVVFTPETSFEKALSATTRAAVAVNKALSSLYAAPFLIKWVNDIYLYDKKVCGILTECYVNREHPIPTLVLGIGINYSTLEFPDDISDIASSLPVGNNISRSDIIREVLKELSLLINDFDDISYVNYIREHSFLKDKEITYIDNEETIHAHVEGIDDTAGLIVKLADGCVKTLRNGEVSHIRKA